MGSNEVIRRRMWVVFNDPSTRRANLTRAIEDAVQEWKQVTAAAIQSSALNDLVKQTKDRKSYYFTLRNYMDVDNLISFESSHLTVMWCGHPTGVLKVALPTPLAIKVSQQWTHKWTGSTSLSASMAVWKTDGWEPYTEK